jgi:hypothetical protein
MYAVRLQLRPTGALTFRILPGSILDITTYPFVPPSTLSGWLYRIWRFAVTRTNPEFLETGLKDSPFYYLPRALVSLGAYSPPFPSNQDSRPSHTVHRTRRHGTKGFSSTSRSALVTEDMEAPQLHTWSYLLADRFTGYVVCRDLEPLQTLVEPLHEEGETLELGCKIGKEGFAYLEHISEPMALEAVEGLFEPPNWSLLPLEEAANGQLDFDLYTLYKPTWKKTSQNWLEAAPVEGFTPIPLVLPQRGHLQTKWWKAPDILIPQSLVEVLS